MVLAGKLVGHHADLFLQHVAHVGSRLPALLPIRHHECRPGKIFTMTKVLFAQKNLQQSPLLCLIYFQEDESVLEADTKATFEERISLKIIEMEEKIAEQDQRLGALVEKLKTEMMKKMEDMFAAQNEKILQQDRKIAEQDETIVAFAFARQPCKSPVCDASPTLPEESHLYITGGHSGSNRLSSTEIYPPLLPGCSPPSLPATTSGHSTFVTSEPDALVANCGGFAGSARRVA